MLLDAGPAIQLPKHAKTRPPSAAARWLSCPASVSVVPLYDEDESDYSLTGDKAHQLLEDGLVFGMKPDSDDPDVDLSIIAVLEWVTDLKQQYDKDCKIYAERQYMIPETGEHGTCDVTAVTPSTLHIADYKNGFVPVDVYMNAQMLTYLLGAIAEFGERKRYFISVLQPNYDHRDGPYRTVEITDDQVEWFRKEVAYSIQHEDEFKAGKHCKKSYCPHRASCQTFHQWAKTDAYLAWWPSDINALNDSELSIALDYADTLHGLRDELRKEAMRRIIQQDRTIDGFKIVKSRTDRSFASDRAMEQAFSIAKELGATDDDLYSRKPESVAGLERFFKAKYKHFPNGTWKKAWDTNISECIREFSGSLTLVKAIDGRPSHARGNEFGVLNIPALSTPQVI